LLFGIGMLGALDGEVETTLFLLAENLDADSIALAQIILYGSNDSGAISEMCTNPTLHRPARR